MPNAAAGSVLEVDRTTTIMVRSKSPSIGGAGPRVTNPLHAERNTMQSRRLIEVDSLKGL